MKTLSCFLCGESLVRCYFDPVLPHKLFSNLEVSGFHLHTLLIFSSFHRFWLDPCQVTGPVQRFHLNWNTLFIFRFLSRMSWYIWSVIWSRIWCETTQTKTSAPSNFPFCHCFFFFFLGCSAEPFFLQTDAVTSKEFIWSKCQSKSSAAILKQSFAMGRKMAATFSGSWTITLTILSGFWSKILGEELGLCWYMGKCCFIVPTSLPRTLKSFGKKLYPSCISQH